MHARRIDDAIARVREVHGRVIEARRFRGYSGRARALGGVLALAGAAVMSRPFFPATARAHLIGWGAVCLAAVLLNYGALALWLMLDPQVKRDVRHLRPTVDPLPAMFVGGVLTAVLVARAQYDGLFGTWMLLFGLANLSSRRYLPRVIWPVGLYYLACGAILLLMPGWAFLNPWPMGVVFFVGETVGGIAFFFNRTPDASLWAFFGFRRPRHEQTD